MSNPDLMSLSSALQNAMLVLEQIAGDHFEPRAKDEDHHPFSVLHAAICGVRHVADEIDEALFPLANADEREAANRLLGDAQPSA